MDVFSLSVIILLNDDRRVAIHMKYELLLFDADETLFDFKMAEKQAFLKALKDYS